MVEQFLSGTRSSNFEQLQVRNATYDFGHCASYLDLNPSTTSTVTYHPFIHNDSGASYYTIV